MSIYDADKIERAIVRQAVATERANTIAERANNIAEAALTDAQWTQLSLVTARAYAAMQATNDRPRPEAPGWTSERRSGGA